MFSSSSNDQVLTEDTQSCANAALKNKNYISGDGHRQFSSCRFDFGTHEGILGNGRDLEKRNQQLAEKYKRDVVAVA